MQINTYTGPQDVMFCANIKVTRLSRGTKLICMYVCGRGHGGEASTTPSAFYVNTDVVCVLC